MAMRQKFSKSTVRYTVNGKATFNPMFVSFKLLLAGDVELNPGDAAEEITQLKQVLKQISPVFAEPLTRLFNISITKGLFPNKWKVARVSPLFKHVRATTEVITGPFLYWLCSQSYWKRMWLDPLWTIL
jgi:hypothetical protein